MNKIDGVSKGEKVYSMRIEIHILLEKELYFVVHFV